MENWKRKQKKYAGPIKSGIEYGCNNNIDIDEIFVRDTQKYLEEEEQLLKGDALDSVNDETFGCDVQEIKNEIDLSETTDKFQKLKVSQSIKTFSTQNYNSKVLENENISQWTSPLLKKYQPLIPPHPTRSHSFSRQQEHHNINLQPKSENEVISSLKTNFKQQYQSLRPSTSHYFPSLTSPHLQLVDNHFQKNIWSSNFSIDPSCDQAQSPSPSPPSPPVPTNMYLPPLLPDNVSYSAHRHVPKPIPQLFVSVDFNQKKTPSPNYSVIKHHEQNPNPSIKKPNPKSETLDSSKSIKKNNKPKRTNQNSHNSSKKHNVNDQLFTMTLKDVEYITRIQIMQLITNFPHRDDYYCKMFKINSSAKKNLSDPNTSDSNINTSKLNWQQRLLLASKARPDGEVNLSSSNALMRLKCILDNSIKKGYKTGHNNLKKYSSNLNIAHNQNSLHVLGESIQRVTFRNPKKLIVVDEGGSTKHDNHTDNKNPTYSNFPLPKTLDYPTIAPDHPEKYSRSTSILVEQLYDIVLRLETLKLKYSDLDDVLNVLQSKNQGDGLNNTNSLSSSFPSSLLFDSSDPHNSAKSLLANNDPEDAQQTIIAIEALKQKLEDFLHLNIDHIPNTSHIHRIPLLLNTVKGMRLLPRLLLFLDPQKALKLLHIIFDYGDYMSFINGKYCPKDIETFLNWGFPSILSLLINLPMSDIIFLSKKFLYKWVPSTPLGSKPGLALLTLYLSRAEMLKFNSKNMPTKDTEEWFNFYSQIFSLSKSLIHHVFLPKQYFLSKDISPYTDITKEDSYAWQFFVALVESAPSFDHKLVLMHSLREKIEEVVSISKDYTKLSGINQFLNALELRVEDLVKF